MDQVAEQLITRLRQDPGDGDAYAQLKDHYRRSGDLASLANLLEGWAGNNTHDPYAASDAYVEAAEAVLRAGGDTQRAKGMFQQALHLNVGNQRAGARLTSLLEQAGEAQELAEFLDQYVRALEAAGADGASLAPLYQRLGELWENDFGRPDAARDYYTQVAQLQGNGAQAPRPEAAAPAAADGAALVADYEARIEHAQDRNEKLALVAELATAQADQLGDLEGAILTLRHALGQMPGDIQIMHQLATYLLARTEGLDAQAAATDYRRVAELFYRIAQAVEPELALEYLQSALDAVPEHDGALALLEEHAKQIGREDLLPARWVAFLAAATDGPEVDERRFYLGRAYLTSGQLEDAIYCLQPVAEHGNEQANLLLQEAYARQARGGGGGEAQATPVDEDAEEAVSHPGALPTTRPPALRSDDEVARDTARVSQLRRRVHELVSARRHDEAAEACRQILDIDPNDPEAFNLLESHYRKRRDYAELRDLLLASTRVPGLSVDARKLRLREVATLSESKLRDTDGAISAWRGVVTLDPADADATRSLKRLLKKTQQWDEMAAVLEREALATTSSKDKAALIREIALIHRDRRKDLPEAAEAFRQLHALDPDDEALRDELCELFVQLEYWEDAAGLMRERVSAATEERDKLKALSALAQVLEEKLEDLSGTHDACAEILAIKPNDREAFERMLRVDEASGDAAMLLSTLERRAEVAPRPERPALFVRMGRIAEEQLYDIDKAAEYYGEALDLAPSDEEALGRLSTMFEGAARYRDLVELLRERCLLEKEPAGRAPLLRRIARVLAEQLEDTEGAGETYRELLAIEEDEEALRFLRDVATREDDAEELQDLLRRLDAKVQDPEERRDLLFDRAVLLHERLDRSADALVVLRTLVEEVAPGFEPAIDQLIDIAEGAGDEAGLRAALVSRLAVDGDPETKLAAAKRLADLVANAPDAADDARAALDAWAALAERDPEPRRRLLPLLEKAGDWKALVDALDALGQWEDAFDARDEAVIRAARLCLEQLSDPDGAWERLLPLVQDGNPEAQAALETVAERAGKAQHLAALYVRLAQEAEEPAQQGRYWRSAAETFDRHLDQPTQALEAALRMLATNLEDRDMLSLVDHLAKRAEAWPRLAQVYDRLVRQAEDDVTKVELLTRHANLLGDADPGEALDRILRACALAPNDTELLTRAEALAQRAERSEELLMVYDRRIARADDPAQRTGAAVRAARLCDGQLRDRERAEGYLKAALAQTEEHPENAAMLEQAARDLDEQSPEHGTDAALRALVRAHRDIAERARPEFAARLVLRGAELLTEELDDPQGAFDLLRHGMGLLPADDAVYEATLTAAEGVKRLDALDAHLTRLVDDAIDSETTVALLERRGKLLDRSLDRPEESAAVYQKILQLRPEDRDAASKLRRSLRASRRFQDLLLAIAKQLKRTDDTEERLSLLREVAETWERDLKNRWEALDAWNAVLEESPDDAEATEAIDRIEKGQLLTGPDEDAEDETEAASADEAGDAGDEAPAALEAEAEAEAEAEPQPPPSDEKGSDADAAGEATEAGEAEAHEVEPAAEQEDDAGAESDEDTEPDTVTEDAPEPLAAAPDEVEQTAATEEVPQQAPHTEADPLAASALPDEPPAQSPEADAELGAAAVAGSVEEEDAGDLASLDAGLGGAPEELDLMHDLDADDAVDVEFEDAEPPPPPRSSSPASVPPPLPGRASRPGSLPPPLPTAARQPGSSPPPPPFPPRSSSGPPPLPARTRAASAPPPLPPRGSSAPPLPPTPSSAPGGSVPPPLPAASRPPGQRPRSMPPRPPASQPPRPSSVPPPLPTAASRPPSTDEG